MQNLTDVFSIFPRFYADSQSYCLYWFLYTKQSLWNMFLMYYKSKVCVNQKMKLIELDGGGQWHTLTIWSPLEEELYIKKWKHFYPNLKGKI